jgi:N-methylhydantoinase A
VRIPVIEMVEIGAGGGSIGRIDGLGRLQVGPQSAGSEPGPACYGRGGREPTVTDADLVLGKIDPARFAGGKIRLEPAAAANAVAERIAAPMGTDPETAAVGLSEIVDENMANAARMHAVERGIDLSRRTLIAFGGAAPLHVSRLAEKLGIGRIVVPPDAGVGSAIGFLAAPAAYEIVRSRPVRLDQLVIAEANGLLAEMFEEAAALAGSAARGARLETERQVFMRYAGQGHEIAIRLPAGPLGADAAAGLRAAFEAEYDRLFARHIPGARVEVMSWAVLVSTRVTPPARLGDVALRSIGAVRERRTILDTGLRRRIEVPVLARAGLSAGDRFEGPALVIEDGTATYVSASFDAHVDAGLALVLTRKETAQ